MKNKDAKIIYSRYWYKNLQFDMYPTIYIDEYWDYTIDAFGLTEDWNWFLGKFNEEFGTARRYVEESDRVVDEIAKKYFASNISQLIDDYQQEENHFNKISIFDLPDGEYWIIDLKYGGNQCLKYINALKTDVKYDDFIKTITTSTLLQKSKLLRIRAFYKIDTDFLDVIYDICDTLVYKVVQSLGINVNDVIGIHGDCIYIPINKFSFTEGDHTIDGIDVHIKKQVIKSLIHKGNRIKYQDNDGLHFFYKNPHLTLETYEYLSILKHIKNQQPNQMDLTVGYEDQIFYVMDD